MKNITRIVLVVCCLLALAACKAAMQPTAPAKPQRVEVLPVLPVSEDQAPADIKLVSAALIDRLRGDPMSVENVRYAPSGTHEVGEQGFKYDGFVVQDVAITGYQTEMEESGDARSTLEGIMLFKDFLNRRTGVYFAAEYVVGKTEITITKSVASGIPPDYPKVETYFVPEKPFKAAKDSLATFSDYYIFAIENAEPMTYSDDATKIGANQKYFIMTFCKDRLFEESSLDMKVTNKPFVTGRKLAEPVYINDSGWRIMIAGGKFKPGSMSNKFYVFVSYKLDSESKEPATVVGEFHNSKEMLKPTP